LLGSQTQAEQILCTRNSLMEQVSREATPCLGSARQPCHTWISLLCAEYMNTIMQNHKVETTRTSHYVTTKKHTTHYFTSWQDKPHISILRKKENTRFLRQLTKSLSIKLIPNAHHTTSDLGFIDQSYSKYITQPTTHDLSIRKSKCTSHNNPSYTKTDMKSTDIKPTLLLYSPNYITVVLHCIHMELKTWAFCVIVAYTTQKYWENTDNR
jgi:hypothetical protein